MLSTESKGSNLGCWWFEGLHATTSTLGARSHEGLPGKQQGRVLPEHANKTQPNAQGKAGGGPVGCCAVRSGIHVAALGAGCWCRGRSQGGGGGTGRAPTALTCSRREATSAHAHSREPVDPMACRPGWCLHRCGCGPPPSAATLKTPAATPTPPSSKARQSEEAWRRRRPCTEHYPTFACCPHSPVKVWVTDGMYLMPLSHSCLCRKQAAMREAGTPEQVMRRQQDLDLHAVSHIDRAEAHQHTFPVRLQPRSLIMVLFCGLLQALQPQRTSRHRSAHPLCLPAGAGAWAAWGGGSPAGYECSSAPAHGGAHGGQGGHNSCRRCWC